MVCGEKKMDVFISVRQMVRMAQVGVIMVLLEI